MGRRPKQTFLQTRHTNGQQATEKMLNIANYQRNSNPTCNEVPPHTGQKGLIKKSTNNTCWRGCGEKEMLLHCSWECKLIQPLWKMIWRFLKTSSIEPPYDPAIPLLGTYPEKNMV